MANDVNRRDFLKAAAIAAGPAAITARGANEKVNIGWIGVGTRGNAGIEWLHTAAPDDVHLSAICDTYQGYIARGKDRVQTIWGNTPKTYLDYHELLADKDIDAVFIMTPEHLHHDMAIAAFKAGKNVYLEKPLAHTIEEGWEMVQGLGEIRQDRAGGHPEPQFLAVQEGQGTGGPGHDRRRAFRARVLVSQRAARGARVALRDPE